MNFLFDTDLDALNALYNRQGALNGVGAAMERLRAGIRIHTITEASNGDTDTLLTQINAMNQSIAATQTMIDQFKETEGELGRINYLIDTIRRRAREVAEDTDCDPMTAREDQAQIRTALRAIDRIAAGLCSHHKVWWAGSYQETGTETQIAAGVETRDENSISLSLPDLTTHCLGITSTPMHTLANIDVTTASGASRAIRILNAASATVDSYWEQLCAFRHEALQPVCNAMYVRVGNISATLTTVRQAEMAEEAVDASIAPTVSEKETSSFCAASKLPVPFQELR